MLVALLQTWALATEPVEIDHGLLANVGAALGSATVVRIEAHPEYERYWLLDESGRSFAAELTRTDGVHQGLCEAQGLVLFPRPELVHGELAPITVEPWCATLAQLTPGQAKFVDRKSELAHAARWNGFDSPALIALTSGSWQWASACGAIALAALVWTVRKDLSRFAAVVGAAGALRMGLADPQIWNGSGAAYEKLLLAWGQMRGAPYGSGFESWMAPAVHLLGANFAAVSVTNLCFSSLTVGLMYRLAVVLTPAAWSPSERARFPFWVGAAAATLPVAVFLSRTEAMHISAVAFGVLAVLLTAEARVGSWVAGVGAVAAMLAALQTRPDLAMVALPVVAFGFSRRAALLVLVAGAVAVGVALSSEIPELVHFERLWSAQAAYRSMLPRVGPPGRETFFQLFLHASFTPAAWWGAAAIGAWAAPAALRWRLVAWIAVCVPFLGKVMPLADAVRLQLFAQYGWVVLVGLGLTKLGVRLGLVVGVVAALVQCWLLPLRWAHHDEFDFLAEVVPSLPVEAHVRSQAFGHRNEGFVRVMQSLGPARWAGPNEELSAGPDQLSLQYRSVGEDPPAGEPFLVREISGRTDVDVRLPDAPVVVGFYFPPAAGPASR